MKTVSPSTFKVIGNTRVRNGSVTNVPRVTSSVPYHDDGSSNIYLRCFDTNQLDYQSAKVHFNAHPFISPSACTSLSFSNGFVLRNYDWTFDSMVNFVVRSNDPLYHSSIGVACQLGINADSYTQSVSELPDLNLVPFYLLDGINEHGLYASMNVVPVADVPIKNTVPQIELRESVCSIMLVRYILDHFTSVSDAIDYLKNYVEIFAPKALIEQGFQLHFQLVDSTQSIILEFNGPNIVAVENVINANFYQFPIDDLTSPLPTIVSHSLGGPAPTSVGILPYSQGLERYNICLNKLTQDPPLSAEDVLTFGKQLWYSRLYRPSSIDTDYWFSEFCGTTGLSVDSNSNAFDSYVVKAVDAYNNRTRQGSPIWITRHSCCYNLIDKTLHIMVEEDPNMFTFNL